MEFEETITEPVMDGKVVRQMETGWVVSRFELWLSLIKRMFVVWFPLPAYSA